MALPRLCTPGRVRLGLATAAAILLSACQHNAEPQAAAAPAAGPAEIPAVTAAPSAAAPSGGGNPMQRLAASNYTDICSSCHGVGLAGGRGPSLFNPRLLSMRSDAELFAKIVKGVEGAEMPAFEGILPEDQIWQIITYIRIQAETIKPKPAFLQDPNGAVITSEKQKFRLEVLAKGLETPWGLAFLPDGRMLVTERPGRLRIIDKAGALQAAAISGTPKVWERQDGGMLDVAIHPDYARNGWIYLSYAELQPGFVVPATPEPLPPGARAPNYPSMTVIVRGKINARNEWVEQQELFRAPVELYTTSGAHYGSRFGFDKAGKLFYTLGERNDMKHAQRLDSPLGKIHRINDDGSIPADNPFVKIPGAIPSIWSYGHRNPQGLAWDPASGLLWESEHGPVGGDEVNIISPGRNYGWGVISMGMQQGISKREEAGMEQPIAYFTPTIAPSGISFYTGSRYPGWKGNLFVAALAGQHLRRLEVSGGKIVAQEIIFQQFGRTRAIATGPDGLLYVLLQNPTGSGTGLSLSSSTPGSVVRLVPFD